MKVTEQERQELHEYLDYLLMVRENLEVLDVNRADAPFPKL